MPLIQNVFAQSNIPPAPGGGGTTQTQSTLGAPAATQPPPSLMSMVTLFVPMFLVIYFFIIRPQQKKMKEHQSLLEKLQHGDEIVTNAGFYGKVTGITDKVLTVEIADGVRVKMLKTQIASVNPKGA